MYVSHLSFANICIDHKLGTTEPEIYETEVNGKKAFFIDTPGFDDTSGVDEADILKMTAGKLTQISNENLKLTSILFLHKITENRLTGRSQRLQRVYEKVWGHEAFQSVVLGTAKWYDLGDEQNGITREKELLQGDFWDRMIRRGMDCCRLEDSESSAQQLALKLINQPPVEMQLQRELKYNVGVLIQTAAGQELNQIYDKRIELQERRSKLDESEREEPERLREAQGKLQQTI